MNEIMLRNAEQLSLMGDIIPVYIIVLTIDGNSDIGAHVRSNLFYPI